MLKQLARRLFKAFGFEVRRAGDFRIPIPAWFDAGIPAQAHPLANRAHTPSLLGYRRSSYGDDQRLKYLCYCLDIRGQRVLELGPYFGVHTFILEKLGARQIVAVEAREENLIECRKLQARYRLEHTTFVHQDIERLYRGEELPTFSGLFDLVFACGILYHFPEPVRALRWMHSQSPRLFLATQYVDPAVKWWYRPPQFREREPYMHEQTEYRGLWYREGGMTDAPSGVSSWSFWPYESDLLSMVRNAGYEQIHILGRDVQNGTPHITILAGSTEQ